LILKPLDKHRQLGDLERGGLMGQVGVVKFGLLEILGIERADPAPSYGAQIDASEHTSIARVLSAFLPVLCGYCIGNCHVSIPKNAYFIDVDSEFSKNMDLNGVGETRRVPERGYPESLWCFGLSSSKGAPWRPKMRRKRPETAAGAL
jgi:hypothetical protein